VSLLLNAICFKGAWVNPFDEEGTRYSYFDGKKRTAMMMAQTNAFRYAVNQLYQSIILPYGNGSYQMTVFLPCWDKTLDDVVDALNGENWNAADYQDSEVVLRMPRIETDTEQDLVDVMASLGMENAFTKYGGHGFLDFCYDGGDEANSHPCRISMMRQKAHLKLDEKGTEAAATVVELAEAGMPQYAEFVADRPFLYVISERSTGSIFFIGQYMGEPLENPRHDITLTEEEKQLVEGNNSFAFNFFRKTRGEESSILSPLSVTYALGMLNNGAAGQTQQEICDVLGFGQAGADAINQFCRKMLTEAPTLDKTTAAEIANTIYVNSGLGCELQQGFVDKANEYYDAQPETRNFYDGVTWEVINQWANEHTHGMVPTVFPSADAFNPNAASYLLNALYFKGAWTHKFSVENTHDEPFQGSTNPVPMMSNRWDEFAYTENDLYQAIRLPYGNKAFLMTVFLPREGKSIDDVLASMDGHNWQFQSSRLYKVDLKLPRFKTETGLPLTQVMKELGMPTAFSAAAEFPYLGNSTFHIGGMLQKAAINLDEEGTEAAAVTLIDVATGMPQVVTFHANRPFFYTISERSTGCIFFIGQFLGDATAGISRTEATNKTAPNVVFDLQGRRINGQWKKGLYIVDGKKVVVN